MFESTRFTLETSAASDYGKSGTSLSLELIPDAPKVLVECRCLSGILNRPKSIKFVSNTCAISIFLEESMIAEYR
jgi:hypothetical protein